MSHLDFILAQFDVETIAISLERDDPQKELTCPVKETTTN